MRQGVGEREEEAGQESVYFLIDSYQSFSQSPMELLYGSMPGAFLTRHSRKSYSCSLSLSGENAKQSGLHGLLLAQITSSRKMRRVEACNHRVDSMKADDLITLCESVETSLRVLFVYGEPYLFLFWLLPPAPLPGASLLVTPNPLTNFVEYDI